LKKRKKEREKIKKEKEETARGLFPRADTPYWLYHAGIFPAVRYN
jgi:hypothetical protein